MPKCECRSGSQRPLEGQTIPRQTSRAERYYTIITCYHFGASAVSEYDRLLRSLRASIREVEPNGRLILVANGTDHGAEDPDRVLRDLDPSRSVFIEPITLRINAGFVGGLNAGVAMALTFPPENSDEWIGSVQSSTTLTKGWLENAQCAAADPSAGAIFGRLVIEDDEQTILGDGHLLCKGRTLFANFADDVSTQGLRPGNIPCLSAAFFRRALVAAIVKEYGSFVCENLAYYGDCTDVAIRAKSVDPTVTFGFCGGAIALKRRPQRNRTLEQCSQLLAASLYYGPNYRSIAEDRLLQQQSSKRTFVDARRDAEERFRRPYSLTCKPPPTAAADLDPCWGTKKTPIG